MDNKGFQDHLSAAVKAVIATCADHVGEDAQAAFAVLTTAANFAEFALRTKAISALEAMKKEEKS